ncbi:hypothetical protein T07_7488 [Trichinella nelsoni]|uniref:Uncharacterized protein n=1 Tax=Trichinella nelsoni TaxID=6336 RepID=A0A0V0S5V0_9BILA|nr:hypothetical protein T07_7488 [Trichinella nelsoni]
MQRSNATMQRKYIYDPRRISVKVESSLLDFFALQNPSLATVQRMAKTDSDTDAHFLKAMQKRRARVIKINTAAIMITPPWQDN